MLRVRPSLKRVTYAVELYFNEILEEQLLKARKMLASQMFSYSYYNPYHPSPIRYLTLTEPEIHSRPCLTLFTASNPGGCRDLELVRRLSSVVNDYFYYNSSPRRRGILPVILDLETVLDVSDENHMFVSALDHLGEVNGFRKSLYEEMSSRNVDVKGNYAFGYNCWMPMVHVFKQTWEQYYVHKPHDEKCWKDFCEENNSELIGYANMIAVVQYSPSRVVWKAISLQEREDEDQERGVNILKDELEDEDQESHEYFLQDGLEDEDQESDANNLIDNIVSMHL